MYQVIARTWRPQKFSEVIGQKHVTQTLQNAIRLNRIGHGYIFAGLRGTGKTSLARLLAKALNCQRGPAPEPCGECDSCKEIAAGRSVDVIEIDAASNRGIDSVRELRDNARYAPARDRYKIFIIDEAHQITTEGFNALLKTLEEPPSHVIFLLATTEVHQFPETILSRCQHFSLHALTFSEILGHLRKICEAEKVDADAEALEILAKSGEGSLRDALSRLEQAIAAFGERLEGPAVRRFLGEAPSSLVEGVFSAVKERKRERMLEIVERLVDDGYQFNHFSARLVRTARNLLIIRVAGAEPGLLKSLLESSEEENQRLTALAEGFSEESLMRCLEILLQLYQQLRFSMEPRFQVELSLLKLVDAERLVSIEDLLARAGTAIQEKPEPVKTAGGVPPPGVSAADVKLPASAVSRDEGSRPVKLTPWEQDQLRKQQMEPISRPIVAAASQMATPQDAVEAPERERLQPPTSGSNVPQDESEASANPGAGPVLAALGEPGSERESWAQAIVQRLEEESKHTMASLLFQAKGWEFGEADVRIFLGDEKLIQVFSEKDRKFLDEVCEKVTGRKVKVSLLGDARATGMAITAKAATVKQPGASGEGRVRQDPGVMEFEKLFGTRVTVTRNWKE